MAKAVANNRQCEMLISTSVIPRDSETSFDRIIDGREAVSMLVRIKECIEDPQRIMLDM